MNNKINHLLSGIIAIAMFLTESAMAENVVDPEVKPTKAITVKKENKATPLARVISQSASELSVDKNGIDTSNVDKTLLLEISELKDNSGLVYYGGKVPEAELSAYLSQLKNILGDEQYANYRLNQASRDHQSFHVTLINPYEYRAIDKEKLNLSQKFRVTLHGLGKASKDNKTSYFVVASSVDGQFIRQKLLLNNKDLHVTLGFSPTDVFGISKGRDTLINK